MPGSSPARMRWSTAIGRRSFSRRRITSTSRAAIGWFNTAAFARPSGRGDYGNAPRNMVRKPGVNNWNLAVFKNFGAAGRRSFQFRCEVYNVLNAAEFKDIDRTARFDPDGKQINPTFGTAIGISNPTRPPRVVQLSGRFTF